MFRAPVRIVAKWNGPGEPKMPRFQLSPRIRDSSSNDLALELGEGGHDVQHEIVLRGVVKLRRADDRESDLETPKLIEQCHVMTNAPRQPIKGVNKDLIDRAAPNESKQSVQRRTIERRSRIAVVVKAIG